MFILGGWGRGQANLVLLEFTWLSGWADGAAPERPPGPASACLCITEGRDWRVAGGTAEGGRAARDHWPAY